MKTKKLLIFGSGTLAEIAGYYFNKDSNYQLIGFVDQPEFTKEKASLLDLPVFHWGEALLNSLETDLQFFVAIGYRKTNTVRQERYDQIKSLGYTCASYVSSRANVMSESIGENCFILEGNVLQPFTVVGNNVTMWSGNHLGHHSIVEDHTFIASHAVISGKCRIGRNSFLGVNCCLHDGVEIGPKSIIGAGSIVVESCAERSVFSPAKTESRIIRRDVI